MPVNEKNKLLYIHIPKCAGTYIENLFKLKSNILYSNTNIKPYIRTYQHYTMNMIIQTNRLKNVDTYTIFTTVRNPYYRFLSAYEQYPTRCNAEFKKMINNMSYVEFAKYLLDKINKEGVDFFQYGAYHQFQPMVQYIKNDKNIEVQTIKIDEPNFENELQTLCKKYHVSYSNTRMNSNKTPDTYNYYDEILDKTPMLKKYIQEIYKDDFTYFKYTI